MKSKTENKIIEYLEENLPDSEERIPTPMNADCEVCVVIPCYKERQYIFRPLTSLACQKKVIHNQYEVIIVVNNPAHPPKKQAHQTEEEYKSKLEFYQEALRDNQEVLQLIRYLNSDNKTLDIRLSSDEKESIKKIKQGCLKVFVVDKASKGKTLPDEAANVGGARNRGVVEAVERFHKQAKKDGIIVHTDADTWMDEYYIHNVIAAFAKDPQLVGLAGIDEDTPGDPRDTEILVGAAIAKMIDLYNVLVHRPFLSYDFSPSIHFIGANMCSRAFATVVAGGVPRVQGGEDMLLGYNLEKIGKIIKDPQVVNFPIIRYSPRSIIGKGNVILQYHQEFKVTGNIMVRTIEGAYVLGMIYKQLREARKNYENSPDSLGKILTFNQKSLLGNHQLIGLSQNLHQLYSFRIELLNNVLRKIVQEICSAIDNEIKSIPIDEAVSILIDFYCINTKIKTKFQTIRQEMSRERKNLLAFFEYTADKAYKSAQTEQDVQHLQEYLVTLLGQNTTVLASTLFKNKKFRLERAARLITMSRTKEESLELLKMNYMLDLALPGQSSLFSLLFELQALQRTIEEEIE